MRGLLDAIFPKTLKYRLFTAFFLLILLPFSLLNIYNYQKVEGLMQEKISEQSHEQLEIMNRTLEDVTSIAFKTYVLLGQDTMISEILTSPEKQDKFINKKEIENRFKSINNSFFMYTPFVYYTILDLIGNVYTSYQPNTPLNYSLILAEEHFSNLLASDKPYYWVTDDENYVARDISQSPYLLSLYSPLKDTNYQTYGVARVSIDYSYWFTNMTRSAPDHQDYFIINHSSEIVAQSSKNSILSAFSVKEIIKTNGTGNFVDSESKVMVNYIYMPSLDWFLVNSVPMDVLFNEMNSLKKQYFTTFLLFTATFILITFVISQKMTLPLYQLQKKMRAVVDNNFKGKLSEDKYTGEILVLTRTYNQMLDDMQVLIQKLKAEERQKEAVRFQMLLSQMNPHFLLNTLNIIKWLALRKEVPEISEISISLGKLLETSLNSEKDLIFLQEEFELVEAYIVIQRYKDDRNVEIIYEIEEGLEFALIPKLSIEPLFENAYIHGLNGQKQAGFIHLRIHSADQHLFIEVIDNGVGIQEAMKNNRKRQRKGIGLNNIQERLQLLFKDSSTFDIESNESGTSVRFKIPLLISTPYIEEGQTDVEGNHC